MKVSFSKYAIPDTDDICVVIAFFSPVGYYRPKRNIQYIVQLIKESQINYLIIELLYSGQTQIFDESIVVKAKTVIFSKENLWNIAEKYLPDKYSKIIFLDSDILFDEPKWIDISSQKLNSNDVIQCMEYAYKSIPYESLDHNILLNIDTSDHFSCKESIAKAIKNNDTINMVKHQPGFAIGMRRDFFHEINGFFEYGITGCSDVLFWLSMIDFKTYEVLDYINNVELAKNKFVSYKNNVQKYFLKDRIDFIRSCVGIHIEHGRDTNRFYQNRNKYLPKNISFYHNTQGVLEINSENNQDLKQYWIDRNEDE